MTDCRQRLGAATGGGAGTGPGLHDLPTELVREVLSHADQSGKVACMLASRTLLAAAMHPPLYRAMRMHDPDDAAARFAAFAKPETLTVCARVADDAAFFLENLLDRGAGAVGASRALRSLTVELGTVVRVPQALLALATRFPNLTELKLTVERVGRGCDLTWPPGRRMEHLRTLWLIEHDDPAAGGRNVVVTFDGAQARLPALEHLIVSAQSSDVLSAGADAFPSLRTAVYRSDDDSYGDLDLIDMRLEHLELDVHDESHLDALFGQLAGMRRVDTLSLVAWADVLIDSPLPCLRFEVSLMLRDGCVQLDLISLCEESRLLRDVVVHAGEAYGAALAAAHPVMVRLVSVTSLADFLDFTGRVRLDVTPSARVHLEPL